MITKWVGSRQSYWPDGEMVVEIAGGGRDYANPDMLVPKWADLGEGDEFTDPREAAKAAIAIAEAWRTSVEEPVTVRYGYTAGFTCPFDESTDGEVVAWANDVYEHLPKCAMCGGIAREHWKLPDDDLDEVFCSPRCCYLALAEAEEEPP